MVIRTPENRRSERRYDNDDRLLKEEIGDRITHQLGEDCACKPPGSETECCNG